MFSKTLLLVLLGFMASIHQAATQKKSAAVSIACNQKFVGNIDGGSCGRDKTLYKCTDCPPTNTVFKNCRPLDKLKPAYTIPSSWTTPTADTAGITSRDEYCPSFTSVTRNGKFIGYACIEPVSKKWSLFCGGMNMGVFQPRQCKRCRVESKGWIGDSTA
ncbi:secreted protein [Melampsora americana]|nr:secreted protein [Melampsora americana]